MLEMFKSRYIGFLLSLLEGERGQHEGHEAREILIRFAANRNVFLSSRPISLLFYDKIYFRHFYVEKFKQTYVCNRLNSTIFHINFKFTITHSESAGPVLSNIAGTCTGYKNIHFLDYIISFGNSS